MREKAREIPDCILEASGLEIDELRLAAERACRSTNRSGTNITGIDGLLEVSVDLAGRADEVIE